MEPISLTEWLSGILLGLALLSFGVWLLRRLLPDRPQKPDGSKWLVDLQLRTEAAKADKLEVGRLNQPPTPADPFHRFPRHTRIIVDVVFDGEYRIGWEYEKVIAIPGTPNYFPFGEALKRAEAWFGERFPDAIRGEDDNA